MIITDFGFLNANSFCFNGDHKQQIQSETLLILNLPGEEIAGATVETRRRMLGFFFRT